jgi:NAD(P)-dependent dehydrogenase (short-subunit alcohol dehydrogenase family)
MTGIRQPLPLLQNHTAIVTGAAGGIGGATARALAAHGAEIVLTDIRLDLLTGIVDELRAAGTQAWAVEADLTDPASVNAMVDEAAAVAGGIDILANVAGGPAGSDSAQPIETMSIDGWQRSLTLNLTTSFLMMKAVLPHLKQRDGGAIVSVGSLASIRMSTHAGAAYTAAKSGILGLTRHAAFEFAQYDIRVNAVLPGIVDGALMRSAPPSATKEAEEKIPLGRMTTNEQIANTILYLVSPLSAGVTGEYIVVDGGMQIGSPTSSKVYFAARSAQV